jgi:hypothetical protein
VLLNQSVDIADALNLSSILGTLTERLIAHLTDGDMRNGISNETLHAFDSELTQIISGSIIRGRYVFELQPAQYLKIIKLAIQQLVRHPLPTYQLLNCN